LPKGLAILMPRIASFTAGTRALRRPVSAVFTFPVRHRDALVVDPHELGVIEKDDGKAGQVDHLHGARVAGRESLSAGSRGWRQPSGLSHKCEMGQGHTWMDTEDNSERWEREREIGSLNEQNTQARPDPTSGTTSDVAECCSPTRSKPTTQSHQLSDEVTPVHTTPTIARVSIGWRTKLNPMFKRR